MLALGGSACASDDTEVRPATEADRGATTTTEAPNETPPDTASESPSSDTVVREFFNAVGADDVKSLDQALTVTEPNSPANAYIRYLTELSRAGGESPLTPEFDGDQVKACGTTTEGESVCFVYSDISVNNAGQIVSFAVDGVPLADRISWDGPIATAQGVTARSAIAYESAGGDLLVVIEIENGASTPFAASSFDSVYIEEGRQYPLGQTSLFTDVRPGATAVDVAYIEAGQRGGTLEYRGHINDFATEVVLPISVP